MKKQFLSISGLAAVVILAACGGSATNSGDRDSAAKAGHGAANYTVDVNNSSLKWRGWKFVGTGEHVGTIAVKEGTLHVEDGKVTAGSFVIDMTSIRDTDMDDTAKRAMLEGHLKSDEFFNVAKFPTGKFEIVSVTEKAADGFTHEITGNLALRDSVRKITFPASITVGDKEITASGKVVINRLEWGINYDKEKMSLAEAAQQKAKNGIVNKEIEIEVSLKANR